MPFPHQESHTPTHPATAPSIEAVLFDYGMVLSGPPDPATWASMRTLTGLDENRFHAAYWEFRHDYDRAALTGHAYWKKLAERTGITLDEQQIETLLAEDVILWTQPNQPMIDFAARLQHAGIRTGILSNIGDCIAYGIIARLPWLTAFNHCTWSHALFMAKPEAAIYTKTAEALGTPPAHILFIDDKQENIKAAATVGMQPVQYTSQDAFEQEMRDRGFAWLLDIGLPASNPPSLQTA